jgi:hypothetical protein
MDLKSRLVGLAGRFIKKELDPDRAAATWRRYDQDHHYGDYLAHCQSVFRRDPPPRADDRLAQQGYTYLRALSPEAARQAAGEIMQRSPLQQLKKDDRNLEGFRITDRQWLNGFLGQVLQGEVDTKIAGYFGSEYLVHWVTFSLTRQAPEQPIVSFKWHCDKGPSAHLKLIVYLNPTIGHGGNTEFMNLEDTMAVARRGYVFGWSKSRTSDVAHLSRIAGRRLATEVRERDAGEAVLFQPSRVLHRGVSPTRGDRLAATLCLLPSPVHWQRAFDSGTLSDLAVDEKWHEDARELPARLEGRPPLDA